jgi:hypothetical protein
MLLYPIALPLSSLEKKKLGFQRRNYFSFIRLLCLSKKKLF